MTFQFRNIGLTAAILLSFLLALGLPSEDAQGQELPRAENQQQLIAKGALLYKTASCVGCHSWPEGDIEHLAGGRDALTEFGTFYTPNISPDSETGLGLWSEEDFFRAIRQGRSPSGKRYWPTFPYQAYTNLSDEDIRALWAYLQSEPAISSPKGKHNIAFPYNLPGLLRLWRGLFFEEGPYVADKNRSESWNRGAYISSAMGYCAECHTPRTATGGLDRDRFMAGGINRGKAISETAPNLTPDPEFGISQWSQNDLVEFLSSGLKPDGSKANLVMHEKVMDSFQYLSPEDKSSVAEYILALPAIHYDPPQE